jgi:hypothetical protein
MCKARRQPQWEPARRDGDFTLAALVRWREVSQIQILIIL